MSWPDKLETLALMNLALTAFVWIKLNKFYNKLIGPLTGRRLPPEY
jgi:hypothetical protein